MFHANLVFDKKAVCQSPVCDDYERVVEVDETGDEHIAFKKVDYRKIQESLGSCENWSLRSLVAAGIDPDFGTRTGFGTGLQAASAIGAAAAAITGVLESESKNDE